MNSNVEALIAEVKSDLSKYADASLLDEDSMYRDIILGMKRFGNDIMELHETMVEVEEGFATLPDNFYSLYLAALCSPRGFAPTCDTEVEFHDLQSSHFYVERTKYTNKWNECDSCGCEDLSENVIRENLFFKKKKVAEFYYDQPQLLSLGKTFNKNNCHSKCRNKLVKDNPNQIVIVKFRLQANFNEGDIYLQYYGLPLDENGNIDIPESKNGHLEEYLEYRLKRKAAERLIGNNDATGLQNLYQVYRGEEQVNLKNASNELKMRSITPESMKRLKRLNRLESLQYESAFTRMYS
jgi:hypothetical protein